MSEDKPHFEVVYFASCSGLTHQHDFQKAART